jgi:2-methylcitrate dehydratase PrpD
MQRGLTAENLQSLVIWMTKKGHLNVGWPYVPGEVVSAQMNASFTAAVKLLDGDAFINQYQTGRLTDPKILSLIDRIRIRHDPELDKAGAEKRHAVHAEATLLDGRVLTIEVQHRLGSAEYPVSLQDIERKFRQLTETSLTTRTTDEIVGLVGELENQYNLSRIIDLLACR